MPRNERISKILTILMISIISLLIIFLLVTDVSACCKPQDKSGKHIETTLCRKHCVVDTEICIKNLEKICCKKQEEIKPGIEQDKQECPEIQPPPQTPEEQVTPEEQIPEEEEHHGGNVKVNVTGRRASDVIKGWSDPNKPEELYKPRIITLSETFEKSVWNISGPDVVFVNQTASFHVTVTNLTELEKKLLSLETEWVFMEDGIDASIKMKGTGEYGVNNTVIFGRAGEFTINFDIVDKFGDRKTISKSVVVRDAAATKEPVSPPIDVGICPKKTPNIQPTESVTECKGLNWSFPWNWSIPDPACAVSALRLYVIA